MIQTAAAATTVSPSPEITTRGAIALLPVLPIDERHPSQGRRNIGRRFVSNQPMPLPELLEVSSKWLAWSGLGLSVLTVVAFVTRWGLRFRLVGVSSFTFLLAVSCWAFSISYSPPVRVEGARQVPIVFDNGTDLVVAQASKDFEQEAITPTLNQIAENLRPGGRSREVRVRLRQLQAVSEGTSKPVVLGETKRDFSQG